MRARLLLALVALVLAPAFAGAHHGDTILSYVDASGRFLAGTAAIGVGTVDDGRPIPPSGVGAVSLATAAFATHPCHPDLQIILDFTPENATVGTDETALIVPYQFQIKIVHDETGEPLPGATFDLRQPGWVSYTVPPEHARNTTLRAELYLLVGADVSWTLAIRGWLDHEGCVVVSEVEANPHGADGGREWVELANLGFTPVDLSGWTIHALRGATAELTLPEGTSVPGGGRLVATFPARAIDNEDEIVALVAPDGVEYARTPALTDTADDTRTNQLDVMGGAWAFAIGTPGT